MIIQNISSYSISFSFSIKLLGEFERKNVLLWDETNDDNRLEFSADMSESRVVQYESSRGLEGWTVCCLNFDEYMLNWALLPMTRAIDTLIITLHDENNTYSESLLKIAEQHPDYVRII